VKLFLQPEDVWLFRDGRPFSAGSDYRAQSLFPPMATTVQGMLRSYHLVVQGIDLGNKAAIADAVGTAACYPSGFQVRGPFLACQESEDGRVAFHRYYPLPEDAVGGEGCFQALTPISPPNGVSTCCPTPHLLWDPSPPRKREKEWWLCEDELALYLQGEFATAVDGEQLYEREARFGIGQDAMRHTTAQGLLFEVQYIRPRDGVGLYIEVEGLPGWPAAGVLCAGGENRAGRFQQIEAEALPTSPDPLPQRFKLYFATPTYFGQGWVPDDWGQFIRGDIELKCAAIGRYRSFGGFDLAADAGHARAHKASRRYVPAGSVYFFESSGKARLEAESISDDPAPIGWGQVFVGQW